MFKSNLMKMTRSRSSFTLIELLIVIGIMLIFTALSLSIIVSLRQQRQVKSVAEQVKTRIMEAHSYAVSPRKDAATGLTSIQFQIINTTIPDTLQIKEIKPTGSISVLNPPDTLPKNIIFDPSSFTIGFRVSPTTENIGEIVPSTDPGSPTSLPIIDDQVSFIIKSSSKSYTMTVNQLTGSVEIK